MDIYLGDTKINKMYLGATEIKKAYFAGNIWTSETSNLWTPSQTTTELWLDASDSSTITTDTGVSVWVDKSGNGNNATQSTGSNQPTVSSSALNGLDVLEFNGTSQYINTPATLDLTGETTMFMLVKTDTISGDRSPLNALDDDCLCPFQLYMSSTGVMRDWRPGAYTPVMAIGEYTIIRHQVDSNIDVNMDANFVTGSTGVTSTVFSGTRPFNIGQYQNTGALGYWDGTIAEVILVAGAITTANKEKLEGYLAWKWGMESELPAGHPYKSSAPTID